MAFAGVSDHIRRLAAVACRVIVDARSVLFAFAISRLVVLVILVFGRGVIGRGWFWQPGDTLGAFTQWDSVYYLHIARHGYFHSPATSDTVAFFPMFPLLTRAASLIFHDFRAAGVATANICLLVSGVLLHRLVRVDFADRRVADAAVTFLMFSPVSFFFSVAYTEATFLMFAIATFLAAVRGRWWLAGVCGMCLAATRNVGFWVAIPLFLEHLRQAWDAQRPLKVLFHRRLLAIALVPLGLALFMLLGYWKGNDLLAFSHAGAKWGRVLVTPLQTLSTAKYNDPFYQWLFLGALTLAGLAWCAGAVIRLRLSYLVWATLLVGTYLCSNSLEAIPRYLSVVFPFFIVAGIIAVRFPAAYEPLLAVSVMLLTLCTLLLANGYWMT